MSLTKYLKSYFNSGVRSRGQSYYRGQLVNIEEGNHASVVALAHGSSTYEILLERDGLSVQAMCDCPYFTNEYEFCKHIWAVLLAAEEEGYLMDSGTPPATLEPHPDADENGFYVADEDDVEEVDESIQSLMKFSRGSLKERALFLANLIDRKAAPNPPPPEKPEWKSRLESIHNNSQRERHLSHQVSDSWPQNSRILYIVDADRTRGNSPGLFIELAVQTLKQNGEWGKPQRKSIYVSQLLSLPEERDRRILTFLKGPAETGYSSIYSPYKSLNNSNLLDTPMQHVLLPLMCETGRCVLRESEDSTELRPLQWSQQSWSFRLQCSALETDSKSEQTYEVKGFFERDGERFELSEPRLIVPEGTLFCQDWVAPFDAGDAHEWIRILRHCDSIRVPASEAADFVATLIGMPVLPAIDLPDDLRWEEVNVDPQPCLRAWARNSKETSQSFLWIDVSFDYDGHIFKSGEPERGVYHKDSRRYVIRSRQLEAAAIRRMTELNVKDSPYYRESDWQVSARHFSTLVATLLAEGWQVEAEGKLLRNAGQVSFSVTSGIDWFELHGEVDFGGTSARLPELLSALRKGEDSILLGDGTYGVLPQEWLKKYGPLAEVGEKQKDHIRFKPGQVGLLDALLASQPSVSVDEAFTHARNRLLDFKGVKPIDPPKTFVGELRPYQREGLGWLNFLQEFQFGGCLADDMGLGKTVQVLALLEGRRVAENGKPRSKGRKVRNPKSETHNRTSLAVVPNSLVFNWIQEAARFAPRLRVLDHTGSGRDKDCEYFEDYDLVITTYGTLRRDITFLKDYSFECCILDEAQAIKNSKTAAAKAARLLNARHRLALSGTPIENHLGELWSLFEFLNPGMLGSASVFGMTGTASRNPDPVTAELLSKALRPFILRRTKDQVATDLPAKLEQTIYCELDKKQRRQYDELREHYRTLLLKKVDDVGIGRSKIQILEALLRLRQAAIHPGLIDPKKSKDPSAKLDVLLPQIREVIEEGHNALVFSQFTKMLGILRNEFDSEGVDYEYLDGRTRNRQEKVDRFQNDPNCKLFLISLKAGGLGLNLTSADYVFLLDPWWNPAVEAQAIDRAHRIGQTRQVFAYRLIARDTVEEKVLQLQETKRELADAIINADNSLIRSMGKQELELLLS